MLLLFFCWEMTQKPCCWKLQTNVCHVYARLRSGFLHVEDNESSVVSEGNSHSSAKRQSLRVYWWSPFREKWWDEDIKWEQPRQGGSHFLHSEDKWFERWMSEKVWCSSCLELLDKQKIHFCPQILRVWPKQPQSNANRLPMTELDLNRRVRLMSKQNRFLPCCHVSVTFSDNTTQKLVSQVNNFVLFLPLMWFCYSRTSHGDFASLKFRRNNVFPLCLCYVPC